MFAIHVTKRHSGKMEGMISISTSCKANKFCALRAKNKNSICSKCYAQKLVGMRKNLENCLANNTKILSKEIIPVEYLPTFLNYRFIRLESFGDLINTIHLRNYINICNKSKETTFALWTKNLFITDMVFNHMKIEKPKNLIIIASSPIINQKIELKEKHWYIDKIFTVYDKKHAKHTIINCGKRKCLECLRCYKKDTENEINELLK